MAKGTNVITKFTNSIYNVKEFPKYIKEGVGKAILYAFILSIFVGGLKGIVNVVSFNKSSNRAIEIMNDDKYKFSIADGKLNIENSPLKIEENNMLIYMDKDININEEDKIRALTVHVDSYVLILKDGIIFDSNINQSSEISKVKATYNELNIVDGVNNKTLIEMIRGFKIPIIILIFIIYIIQEFIFYLFIALMIAIFSLLPSRIFALDMNLRNLFPLVIYAATLPNILVLILTILIPSVSFDTAGMIGTMLYTYIILNDIRKEGQNGGNI
ncbi:DUF1189 domain-containing protein [Clostridium sp. SHJSY1]|uniref:DUF1189 family protein n=1 Tax=Clostridium sp. SHJSY1 TaxID=2942483 RepID=UPI0028769DD3|nr:DUF1189 family protein [Clostridium sp. SHJSY1]MDS0528139.1 DUF1189 domain-containing protein [Clostridium sp. SHJSY1]